MASWALSAAHNAYTLSMDSAGASDVLIRENRTWLPQLLPNEVLSEDSAPEKPLGGLFPTVLCAQVRGVGHAPPRSTSQCTHLSWWASLFLVNI